MNGSFWDHEQPSGALSIDESITLGQAVCSGNANSSMFILLPQPHSSCSLVTILKHKRLVEDKMVATLTSMISQTPEIKRFCDVALSTLLQPNQMALCVTCLESEGLGQDVREVALSFNASVHQGDRRKTSQNCFSASRALSFKGSYLT